MLQALAAIVKRQAAIPIAVTGVVAATAHTKPTAAIPINSFVAGKTFGAFGDGAGVHWFPGAGLGPGTSA